MNLYPLVIRTLSVLAILGAGTGAVLLAAHLSASGRAALHRRFSSRAVDLVGWAGLVAFVAMAGSLYLSEGVGFTPCVLCWYQRIAMYPLVVIGAVGVVRRDPGAWRYGVPLAAVGLVIALYHVALQYQPALDIVSCSAAAPCTGRYVLVFGFVSIPVLAAAAFWLILALLLTARTGAGRSPTG